MGRTEGRRERSLRGCVIDLVSPHSRAALTLGRDMVLSSHLTLLTSQISHVLFPLAVLSSLPFASLLTSVSFHPLSL
jgi:hypothetical protein